jgi:hypothetical protein
MPGENFYEGCASLPDFIDRFAEHHHDQAKRHISEYEHYMLAQVAARLREDERARRRINRALAAK